jgi:hypothetical protein
MSNSLDEAWESFTKESPPTVSGKYKEYLRDIYMAGARQFAYYLTKPDSTVEFLNTLVDETLVWVDDWNARVKEAKDAKVPDPEIIPDSQTPPDSV